MSQSGTIGVTGSGPGSGDVVTLTGNTGGPINPDGLGNINTLGGSNITINGAGTTLTTNLNDTVSISGSMTAGTGFIATTGDVDILDGNLNLPQTANDGSVGCIFVDGQRMISFADSENIYFGLDSGTYPNVVGVSNNIAIGSETMNEIAGGSIVQNVAIGFQALNSVSANCSTNVAIGSGAISVLLTGDDNTAVGSATLSGILNGASGNIALGASAGSALSTNDSYNICIGNAGVAGDNNTIRIGTQGSVAYEQDTTFIAGIYGVTPTQPTPQMVVVDSLGQLGSQALVPDVFWNEITAASANMVIDDGYVTNNAGPVTLTLPNTAVFGSIVRVAGKGAGGWIVAQNAGEQIIWDSVTATTVGVGGSLASTDQYDTVELLCIVASTTWVVLTAKGNITVT